MSARTRDNTLPPSCACYVFGHGDRWEGVCVDLDLAVAGRSLEEVRDKLTLSVASYIEDALHEDGATARRLLRRKAPLRVRLGLALRMVRDALRNRRDGDDRFFGSFGVPCHG